MVKRWRLCVLALAVFLFGLSTPDLAASATATQVVTIRVEPFAVISLVGTGRENRTWLVVDSTGITTTSQELEWTTNLEGMKVAVQSNLTADEQDYILRVRAVNLNSKGTSKGWITINEELSNLVTGITREIGGCSLEYEALLKINENPGCDEHIITYTITEQ